MIRITMNGHVFEADDITPEVDGALKAFLAYASAPTWVYPVDTPQPTWPNQYNVKPLMAPPWHITCGEVRS